MRKWIAPLLALVAMGAALFLVPAAESGPAPAQPGAALAEQVPPPGVYQVGTIAWKPLG